MNPDSASRGAHPAWVPTLFTLSDLRRVLDVQAQAGQESVALENLPSGHGGILGAQLLGQLISLSESLMPGKDVRTLSMQFLRPSRWDTPLVARVALLLDGRRFASLSVDFQQGEAVIAHATVMLGPPIPAKPGGNVAGGTHPWISATSDGRALWPWEVRTSAASSGPTVDLWARIPVSSLQVGESRALIAFATESLTVPLAIDRRGDRADGALIPQVVLAHNVTFSKSFYANSWHRHVSRLVSDSGGHLTGAGWVFDDRGESVATTQTVAFLGEKRTFA